jgi:hypothetical protein
MEHSAIEDADRHEVKGASTATSGQFLKCNGTDSTTFAYLEMDDIIDIDDLTITLSQVSDFTAIPYQDDSTATDVATLVTDFNTLKNALVTAGIMAEEETE